ncbi:hypothetical protein GVAV_000598 [Gurleya vavrai]
MKEPQRLKLFKSIRNDSQIDLYRKNLKKIDNLIEKTFFESTLYYDFLLIENFNTSNEKAIQALNYFYPNVKTSKIYVMKLQGLFEIQTVYFYKTYENLEINHCDKKKAVKKITVIVFFNWEIYIEILIIFITNQIIVMHLLISMKVM